MGNQGSESAGRGGVPGDDTTVRGSGTAGQRETEKSREGKGKADATAKGIKESGETTEVEYPINPVDPGNPPNDPGEPPDDIKRVGV
jgi:hypothetical protein